MKNDAGGILTVNFFIPMLKVLKKQASTKLLGFYMCNSFLDEDNYASKQILIKIGCYTDERRFDNFNHLTHRNPNLVNSLPINKCRLPFVIL